MSAVNTQIQKPGGRNHTKGGLLWAHIEMESFDHAAKLISLIRKDKNKKQLIRVPNILLENVIQSSLIFELDILLIKNIDWAKNNNRPVGYHRPRQYNDKEKEKLGHR